MATPENLALSKHSAPRLLTHKSNQFTISNTRDLYFTVASSKKGADGNYTIKQFPVPGPLVITRGNLQNLATELRDGIRSVKKFTADGISIILKTNTSFNVRAAIVSDAFIELLRGSGSFLDDQNRNGWTLRQLRCLNPGQWGSYPANLISDSAVNSIISAYNEFAGLKSRFVEQFNAGQARDGSGREVYAALKQLATDPICWR